MVLTVGTVVDSEETEHTLMPLSHPSHPAPDSAASTPNSLHPHPPPGRQDLQSDSRGDRLHLADGSAKETAISEWLCTYGTKP